MIEEIIYFTELYEPNYGQTIQGASIDKIQYLETLIGRRLPAFYYEFLLLMGQDMGSLEMEDFSFTIDSIINFYEKRYWVPPANYILLAKDQQDPYMDYYLESVSENETDCAVVRFPSEGEFSKDKYFYPTDHSLKDFLFSHVFSEKRMNTFSYEEVFHLSSSKSKNAVIVSINELIALISKQAEELGFKRVGHACSGYHFYDRGDAAIYMHIEKDYIGGTLAALKKGTIATLAESLFNGI